MSLRNLGKSLALSISSLERNRSRSTFHVGDRFSALTARATEELEFRAAMLFSASAATAMLFWGLAKMAAIANCVH